MKRKNSIRTLIIKGLSKTDRLEWLYMLLAEARYLSIKPYLDPDAELDMKPIVSKEVINQSIADEVATEFGDDLADVVFEGTGPDGINDFWDVREEYATNLHNLAYTDEAELGRIIAKQYKDYVESRLKTRAESSNVAESLQTLIKDMAEVREAA